MKTTTNRRAMLRGMLGGSAISVGLPPLDVFLDGNGQAFAADKAPLPVRFGTWFWGCGVNTARWFPKNAPLKFHQMRSAGDWKIFTRRYVKFVRAKRVTNGLAKSGRLSRQNIRKTGCCRWKYSRSLMRPINSESSERKSKPS